jgi:hypothetical protein
MLFVPALPKLMVVAFASNSATKLVVVVIALPFIAIVPVPPEPTVNVPVPVVIGRLLVVLRDNVEAVVRSITGFVPVSCIDVPGNTTLPVVFPPIVKLLFLVD